MVKDTLGIEGKRKIAYLLPETMQTRRQRSNIFEALKEKKASSLNSTHSKSIFKKPQRLYRHTKAKKKVINSSCATQEMLKEVFRAEGK